MRIVVILIAVTVLAACGRVPKPHSSVAKSVKKSPLKPKIDTTEEIPEVHYTEHQLIAFMDSVRRLPTDSLAKRISYPVDSISEHLTTPLNRQFSAQEFKLLQNAIRDSSIKYEVAEKLFGKLTVDRNCKWKGVMDTVQKGSLYLQYYSFGKNKNAFDYFAVALGDVGNCQSAQLFYFKGNKLIGCQDGYSRWGDDIKCFLAPDGQPVVIKVVVFETGSGIWWNHWYFFKYDGDKIVPVLNELQNGNSQPGWEGAKCQWLKSTILKTEPLTIKMVYYFYTYKYADENGFKSGPYIVNDSTVVHYRWAGKNKLEGEFDKSKITKAQVLTYYLDDNDLLFINTYQADLDRFLSNKKKRKWVLIYLNDVMNNIHREKILAMKKK